MKIKLIVVGKTKNNYLKLGEDDFIKRLKNYIKFELIIIKEEKTTTSRTESQIKNIEGDRIKHHINSSDWIIALDSHAHQKSSKMFAALFSHHMNICTKTIIFIIGGHLGLSNELLQNANEKLSISKMTFTHEMARLILLEQIYRAFTILNGEKYHK